MSKPTIIICNLRIHGVAPISGSIIQRCSGCDSEVYVSPATIEAMVKMSAKPLCTFCFARRAERFDDEILPPTEKQLDEMRAESAKRKSPKN